MAFSDLDADFHRLASVLTGLELPLEGEPGAVLSRYCADQAALEDQAAFEEIMNTYDSSRDLAPSEICTRILSHDRTTVRALGRSIIACCYLGVWNLGQPASDALRKELYLGALVWKAAQARPKGVAGPGVGHWGRPPAVAAGEPTGIGDGRRH